MKVKLQPPSATELAPFNPILPPASITQILLLANPTKVEAHDDLQTSAELLSGAADDASTCLCSQEKVRLRYKLAFTLGDRMCNEAGEVDQFPPQEAWGHL